MLTIHLNKEQWKNKYMNYHIVAERQWCLPAVQDCIDQWVKKIENGIRQLTKNWITSTEWTLRLENLQECTHMKANTNKDKITLVLFKKKNIFKCLLAIDCFKTKFVWGFDQINFQLWKHFVLILCMSSHHDIDNKLHIIYHWKVKWLHNIKNLSKLLIIGCLKE